MIMSNNDDHIENSIQDVIAQYVGALDDASIGNVYHSIMQAVECSLIQEVMESVEGNQSQAAGILGISRNTLRKKLSVA